jgi:hypothetical protein
VRLILYTFMKKLFVLLHASCTLWYRVLSEDSVETLIFFLQLLIAVALGRRAAGRKVLLFNQLSSPHTLTNHKARQAGLSNFSKVILYLVAPRFEHSTLILRAKQHNHTTIGALIENGSLFWFMRFKFRTIHQR